MAFPTATTTGLPAGVTLTASGDIVVTKAGTVLKNLNVNGQIWIRAENVTVENCKITSSNYYGVRIDHGLKGAVVQNCEINGQGKVLNGIGGAGTFVGNNIYGCENGINLEGNVATKIEGNYIHGFKGASTAHFDGIQIFGDNANVEVVHNTVTNDAPFTAVSAIFVANTFGAVNGVNIHDNYFSGGGFPLYFDGTKSKSAITGVTWHDNYVVKGGYGYEYIRADSQGHTPTSTNNTMITSGASPAQAPDKYTGGTTSPSPSPTPTPTPTPTSDIVGTSDNDVLKGTTGGDTLKGLAGNDTYTVNHTGDKVVELTGQGIDKVESTISYTLSDNVENLQLTGDGAISGTGNALNNVITGYGGNNVLKGGAGNDTLNGWGGKDTLWGESGQDVFQFSDKYSANGDKVMDFVHGTDKLDFSKIDANGSQSGDQAFAFDGYKAASFSGSNGHIWAVEDTAANVTHVYAKVDGFVTQVDVAGLKHGMTVSDFLL